MTHKRRTIISSLFLLVGVELILLPGLIPDGLPVVSAAATASYTVTQVSGGNDCWRVHKIPLVDYLLGS